MRIHLVIAQYKESYIGEYSPIVHAAFDEFSNDENPDGLIQESLKELRLDSDLEVAGVVTLEVKIEDILKILRPSATVKSKLINPI